MELDKKRLPSHILKAADDQFPLLLPSGAKVYRRQHEHDEIWYEGFGYAQGDTDVLPYAADPAVRKGYFHLAIFHKDGRVKLYVPNLQVFPETTKLYKGCRGSTLHRYSQQVHLFPGEYVGWVCAMNAPIGTGSSNEFCGPVGDGIIKEATA